MLSVILECDLHLHIEVIPLAYDFNVRQIATAVLITSISHRIK